MTGLEPHPIFPVPTRDEIETMIREIGEPKAIERLAKFAQERGEKIALEMKDPYRYGYRPPIWHVADELLQEGKEIILVDPDWDLDDPALRRRRPPDFLHEAAARKKAGLGPIVMTGKRELWVAGSNRSGKTEYAAAFIANVTATVSHARTWSWSDSEEKSQAKQQPIVWKYIPDAWKQMLNDKGKLKNMNMKIGWGPDGFVGNKFVAPNGSRHWFNNYKQLIQDIEGDQLDASWHDEERDPERIKTVRVRLGDRNGLMIVTFTSIDASFTAVANEYEAGSVTKLEVDGIWLPNQKKDGVTPYEKEEGMTYQKVRRVAVAGPGSDG